MTAPERLSGVLSPVVTPFKDDLSPDPDRLTNHCRWLLDHDVGLAAFGTNSEANSLAVEEKIFLLDYLVDAGIDVSRLMPGTGHCALTDTVKLTKHAVKLGCAGALMLPPFYYKDVSDDGLYASFSEVIDRVGSNDLRIYLYHFPLIAHVGFSSSLVERLAKAFPETVVGIKDSSGDWSNTESFIRLRLDNFRVFVGSESHLLQNLRAGGAGCISGTANLNPAAIHQLYVSWESRDADDMQKNLVEVRSIVERYPMISAIKAIMADFNLDPQWNVVRPPLVSLSRKNCTDLVNELRQSDFDMPGLLD